jgi:hypothetical protein
VEAIIPDWRLGVCGKSEKPGDFMGCGDVALRGLVVSPPSKCSILSLMVLSFSSVAWRRSNKDDFVPFGFSTPLNMTLYRSNLISGMSTVSNPVLLVEIEGRGFEMIGTLGLGAAASACGSVIDLMMMGLCLGIFLLATVLLLVGAAASLDAVAVIDEVLRFASTVWTTLAGSACFLPPNKEPNSLLFCVFVL